MPPLTWPIWAPWHVAVALALLCLLAYWVARLQVGRARQDWADAFFYAPSQKARHRERRQRWQEISWGLLAATAFFLATAAVLYLRRPA